MDDASDISKKRERSVSYPSSSLEVAVADIELLLSNLGKGPFSRDSAAKALGYAGVNGKSASRIATCVHFGLLTRTNSSYCISELSERIVKNITQDERHQALIEAVKTPSLYTKLIDAFNEKALPQMLPNILSRNYGIADRASETAAQVFRDSIEFAGIFRNGIINVSEQQSSGTEASDSENGQATDKMTSEQASYVCAVEQQQEKSRSVRESGEGWSLAVNFTYSTNIPREIRKKINELLDATDDVIDALEKLQNSAEKKEE